MFLYITLFPQNKGENYFQNRSKYIAIHKWIVWVFHHQKFMKNVAKMASGMGNHRRLHKYFTSWKDITKLHKIRDFIVYKKRVMSKMKWFNFWRGLTKHTLQFKIAISYNRMKCLQKSLISWTGEIKRISILRSQEYKLCHLIKFGRMKCIIKKWKLISRKQIACKRLLQISSLSQVRVANQFWMYHVNRYNALKSLLLVIESKLCFKSVRFMISFSIANAFKF